MAAPIYCTHKELKRVFPQLDSFDGKKPVYGWEEGMLNFTSTTIDCYFAHNTGSIDTLYWDGAEIDKIPFNTTETTKVNHASFTESHSSVIVDDGSAFAANDIIKINNEYFKIHSVSTNTLTFDSGTPPLFRGLFNTNSQHHADDSSVYKIVDASTDVGGNNSHGQSALSFVYDPFLDLCILITLDSNPQDYLVEAGEDFTTLVTQYRTDASRYLDSMLDPNMPKEAWKDKEGNYDYIIIRSTALLAANFMIKAHDPNSELANALMDEAMNNIANINAGKAALSWQVTRDSSQGVVRDVVYATAGAIRPVDTRGDWYGDYDLLKVVITTAGALGAATYSVFTKGANKLKEIEVVKDEVITGDYQQLSSGLEIRFAGSTDAILNNEWEIEVFGAYEDIDASSGKAVKMTRVRKHGRVY